MKLISNIKGNVILFTHSISGSFGFKLVEILGEKISKVVAVEPSMFGNIQEKVVPSLETPEKVIANFKGLDFELDMTKSSLPTQKVIDRFTTINDNSKKLFPKNKEEYIKNYINSLVPLHPKLLYELFNIGGSKLKIDDFSKLKKTKFLIISSPDDPLHKEEDPKIVEKLKSENISVEYWKDGSHGTFGNSHMMMVEKNNQDIFNEIDSWIKKN
jgi:pimeloyl-ACP methyl ester carboxylesterase